VRCDGNDVLATWTVMSEAVERARRGEGPTLIELVTYRMGAHTTSDDATRYRDDVELSHWAQMDPIARYTRHLSSDSRWRAQDQEYAETAAQEAVDRLRAAVYDAPDPDPTSAFDFALTAPTPELVRQREQLAHEIAGGAS